MVSIRYANNALATEQSYACSYDVTGFVNSHCGDSLTILLPTFVQTEKLRPFVWGKLTLSPRDCVGKGCTIVEISLS